MSRNRLVEMAAGIKGQIVGSDPEDETAHFEQCNGCKQMYDMRDLAQVLHHDQEMHEAMPVN